MPTGPAFHCPQSVLQESLEHVATLFYSALLTIQVYLSAITLLRFLLLPFEQKKRRQRYVYFLFFTLSLSVGRFIFYLRELQGESENELQVQHSTVLHTRRWAITQLEGPIEPAASFGCTALLWLAGDAFLVWRATIIWSGHRLLRWIPMLVYAISCGVCITSFVCKLRALNAMSGAWTEGEPTRGFQGEELFRRARMAYYTWRITDFSMSVVVSVVTTTMICARLILMKKKKKHLLQVGSTLRSALPYRHIFTIILESSLPFTLVGVASTIRAATLDIKYRTYRRQVHIFPFLVVLWTNALSLGPQLIAFRVISGTSWMSNPATHHTRPICQPLLFADDPVVSVLTAYTDDDYELELQEIPEPTATHDDHGESLQGVSSDELIVSTWNVESIAVRADTAVEGEVLCERYNGRMSLVDSSRFDTGGNGRRKMSKLSGGVLSSTADCEVQLREVELQKALRVDALRCGWQRHDGGSVWSQTLPELTESQKNVNGARLTRTKALHQAVGQPKGDVAASSLTLHESVLSLNRVRVSVWEETQKHNWLCPMRSTVVHRYLTRGNRQSQKRWRLGLHKRESGRLRFNRLGSSCTSAPCNQAKGQLNTPGSMAVEAFSIQTRWCCGVNNEPSSIPRHDRRQALYRVKKDRKQIEMSFK
ncbi:hypothetical protein BKA70DRAFT_1405173 [Coprinopsis sp. MPI-PUGE-AT-0042]|nr:hypothetical protein BKA70DRAFT_1405173 [Coprinopsis sp. MPI-PUGE-AT-0042]